MYLCPLCMRTAYASLDLLCLELTKVTVKHIQCPICSESVTGLDKYTIHLYSHLLQRERHLADKTRNEAVTLNVLSKNMCKSLNSGEAAEQNVSSQVKQSENRTNVVVGAVNNLENGTSVNNGNIFFSNPNQVSEAQFLSSEKLKNANGNDQSVVCDRFTKQSTIANDVACKSMLDKSLEDSSNVVLSLGQTNQANLSCNNEDLNGSSSSIIFRTESSSNADVNNPPQFNQTSPHQSSGSSSDVVLNLTNLNLIPMIDGASIQSFKAGDSLVIDTPEEESPTIIESGFLSGPQEESSRNVNFVVDQKKVTEGDIAPKLYIVVQDLMTQEPQLLQSESIRLISKTETDDPVILGSNTIGINDHEDRASSYSDRLDRALDESKSRFADFNDSSSPYQIEEFIKMESNDASRSPGGSHECDSCNFAFPDAGILRMHQQLVHKQGAPLAKLNKKTYHCQYCNKGFKMKGSLLVHHRVAHKLLTPSIECISRKKSTEGRESSEDIGAKENDFKCTSCSKIFKKEQFLLQHLKTHESKQWECDVCFKCFTTKYFLKKHKRLHTGDQRYFCELCNKAFTFQQSYHKHVLYHTDEKPYQCTTCGRAFKELSTLHNHERIHTGEKPYSCETCGKTFRQRVSCLVHSRIHTGVMPYECTGCHKKFRYKGSEKSHKCPIFPPGQIVLCHAEKKTNSLLSTIRKKLFVNGQNLEGSTTTSIPSKPEPHAVEYNDVNVALNHASADVKRSIYNANEALAQYYIVVPMADSTVVNTNKQKLQGSEVKPPSSSSSSSRSISTSTAAISKGQRSLLPRENSGERQQNYESLKNQEICTNTENCTTNVQTTNVGERQSNSNFDPPTPVQISAPDFFSDPAELFSSLTFSP